jgi:hypothetical protein
LWHTAKQLEKANKELQKLQENNTKETQKLIHVLALVEKSLASHLITLHAGIQDLTETIKEANAKNDKQQAWFLTLAVIGTIFTVLSVVQVIDILIRGIGK